MIAGGATTGFETTHRAQATAPRRVREMHPMVLLGSLHEKNRERPQRITEFVRCGENIVLRGCYLQCPAGILLVAHVCGA